MERPRRRAVGRGDPGLTVFCTPEAELDYRSTNWATRSAKRVLGCLSNDAPPLAAKNAAPGKIVDSATREATGSPCKGSATVNAILEDLTSLSPKRLEKRLEELARDALPSRAATVFHGSLDDGLVVAIHVDCLDRGDVVDLARVLEDDAAVRASCGWCFLPPSRRHRYWRLLLRVRFERPVLCAFAVRFEVRDHPNDHVRDSLPLLLAANRFVFAFDGRPGPELPLVCIAAPTAKKCVLEVLTSSTAP